MKLATVIKAAFLGYTIKKMVTVKTKIDAIQALDFDFAKLRGLKVDWKKLNISFLLDVIVKNNYAERIDTYGALSIEKIIFYGKKHKKISELYLNAKDIVVPENSQAVFKASKVNLDINDLETLANLATDFPKIAFDYEVFYTLLGKKYTYKNTYNVALGLNAPRLCTNRAKCAGLKKNGQLKKGYRFAKGGNILRTKKTR